MEDDLSGPQEPTPAQERAQAVMPGGVRSLSLAVLALLACIYTLHWASAVFIPLLLGVMLSYALSPAVERLRRWRVPRTIGAALLLLALVAGLGSVSYSLSDDASALADLLPDSAQKLREKVRNRQGAPESSIDKVQRAAAKIEQAAVEGGVAASPPAAKGVTRVQIERPRFNIRDYLWSSTLGLVGLLGQAVVVLFISFFLLSAGDAFRRKMVRLAGPTFSRKRITIQMLDEITEQVQRYLQIQVFTSVLVGVAIWLSMWWIGLEHAAVWGVVAAVLNLVPYIGSVATTAALGVVGFLQFGTLEMALLVGGVALLINTLEGNLLTPWLTSRSSRMNPVVIFVGVLAFGWLWGIWGLLLGPPLLMAMKAVCDHVDELKPVGEMLGE